MKLLVGHNKQQIMAKLNVDIMSPHLQLAFSSQKTNFNQT